MNEMMRRAMLLDPAADGGNGGGGDGEVDKGDAIAKAVEEATRGLKENRDTILREKKALQDQHSEITKMLEGVGGAEGLKALREMQERLSKDEVGKLLAEGKHEEWFEKRVGALRGEHQQQQEAAQAKIDELTSQRAEALDRLAKTILRTEVDAAAVDAGVEKTALEDIRLAAGHVFSFDEKTGKHVIKDENGVVLLSKDGQNPKSVREWLEEQKKPRRHWWPHSAGVDARGGIGGGADGAASIEAMGQMSMEEYRRAREKAGMGTGYGGTVRK